ncbi:SGNH/GDSL hydrolase family protein [Dolichospermum sp. LEGE 00246]|uniref:SGNH/GDSL hydrolase family protein n=1 Tax=Dolichospermum sp. LEGE 00246 TaxID=1828605 RepID=UPI0018823BD4|nr:SGNH/GDSL hydrolase family protein [Dolichospermum sp. LEGE 00246]MBE9259352.1 G-D-S-L family lipolytic protein [Dolichospermum sp. LEGE 00246]MDK2407807.1 SGNH/GDSL hydrolase family protein [Aphanizomenon sp. 202]MDK2458018.1 SGNH/GDSL hydrolase family protein [Aphanizomenon sp. PH219]
MSEPYLLAASLLTGLVIPISMPPQITNLPKDSLSLLDLAEGFQVYEGKRNSPRQIAVPEFSNQIENSSSANKSLVKTDKLLPEFSRQAPTTVEQSSVIRKNLPTLEILLSEFRQHGLSIPVKSSFNLNSPTTPTKSPISGSQLYQQRLASLISGQIYTRTDNDENLALSGESNKADKLTYQDWKSLLAMEAKAMAKGQGANRLSILVGDSLSLWFPKDKLPTGKLWLNQGISGDTSEGVSKRLSAFSATRPDVIYVMTGINDLRKGATDKSILVNSSRIIHSLRQSHPSSQIIVQSILPVRSQKIPNSRIRHINAQLAIIAQKQGANYLNIHNWFTDIDGNLRPELTTDGLHLSLAGYQVWQFALEQIEYRVAQIYN